MDVCMHANKQQGRKQTGGVNAMQKQKQFIETEDMCQICNLNTRARKTEFPINIHQESVS